MRALSASVLTALVGVCAVGQAQTAIAPTVYRIQTFAGGGLPTNIPGVAASVRGPLSVAADASRNVYFAAANHVVYRLDAATGILTVAAGNGTPGFSGDNGPATGAQLYKPYGVAVDSSGNLYIADSGNNRVRKVSGGVITTVAGSSLAAIFGGDNGPATSGFLNSPEGVAVDSAGNLYIADTYNNRIREVSNGVITTVAGSGTSGLSGDGGAATSAQLNMPAGLAIASGTLYIADTGNYRVRAVTGGTITSVAGGGSSLADGISALSARLNAPWGVAVDSSGGVYVADSWSYRIRKIAAGLITTVAGNGAAGYSGDGGAATGAELYSPMGVAVDAANGVYIADNGNCRVRKVTNGTIATVAGNGTAGFSGDGGPATSAQMFMPSGVAADSNGAIYVADQSNSVVRKISNGVITTVAGNGTDGYSGDNGPATNASLRYPVSVALDASGNLYIADTSNNVVRKVSGGIITTVAGNGTGGYSGDGGPPTGAQLKTPYSVAIDSAGNLYIANRDNNCIREVSNGVISTVAGTGTAGYGGDNGPAASAQLNNPRGVAPDTSGNLYIVDSFNQRIRKVSSGIIITVAGNGAWGFGGDNGLATSAALYNPVGVAVDSSGNLYIADTVNNRIRKVVQGYIDTIAGNGTPGSGGDNGPAVTASFWQPWGLGLDSAGNVYVADGGNDRIRVLNPAPEFNISIYPSGSFVNGQNGTFSVQVTDYAGSAATSGEVTVTETVPLYGETLVSMAGTGWTCPVGGNACTRSDTLAPGASYPVITITVSVAPGAPSSVVNSISVSGGGALSIGTVSPVTPIQYQPVSISGRVTFSGSGLAGVTLNLIGTQRATATTDSSGVYSFASLPGAGSYTVSLWKAGYSFSPGSASLSDLIASQTVNFTASAVAATANTIAAAAAPVAPGGQFSVPVTLFLTSGVSVDSVNFGVQITPSGGAPALTGHLTFTEDPSVIGPVYPDTGGTSNSVGVILYPLSPPLSGTRTLGTVSGTIPASATVGQNYTVAVTGASANLGGGPDARPGLANGALAVDLMYLVGAVAPSTGDTAPNFGSGSLSILDLIQVLFAVNNVPGYRPAACSDRFDAMDVYPPDTATTRGGDGVLDVRDLILELFRVNNLDTDRPMRMSLGGVCPTSYAAAASQLDAARRSQPVRPRGPSEGALTLGAAELLGDSEERIPVYLEGRRDLTRVALTAAVGDQQSQFRFTASETAPPSLVETGQTGVVVVAWLNGVSVRAGEKALLGYVVAPAGVAGKLRFFGVSASGLDENREIPLDAPAAAGLER